MFSLSKSAKLITLTLLIAAACSAGSAQTAEMYLLQDGQSVYRIVVAPSASPSEKRAAGELQRHFQGCTGAQLPLVEAPPSEGGPMIVVGAGDTARSLGVDPAPADLGEQGYVIRTAAPHLVIAGTPAAGTMYGVYDFLESILGVRWYAPGVTKTPEVKDLTLPDLNKTVKPPFLWRHTSYRWPGKDDDFAAHMRENDGANGPDSPYGLQHRHDGRCHSYSWYIGTGEFFDTHPEYFSEIGGVRRKLETQLCLTNPDVLEIVTERILQRMADKPDCVQHNFSQEDYYNHCQCARCNAMNEQYGSLGGTQFWFVNQLAERTSKIYPDKLIGTLAYMYTEEPPKDLQMHPNVAVWLCHMYPSCDSHAIASCERNADYKRRALAWSKICQHLHIWHYIVDFAHYYNPFPNFRAMAADIRFYRDIGVEGIYLQGMSAGGGGGEFSLLRPYYGTKLLWNPDQDPEALIRDFLQGYYGPAWESIYAYVTLLHDKVEQEKIHMHLYTNPAQGYLTDEVLAQSIKLFDQAEAAVADDKTLLERVRVARMPLTYAGVFPRNGYRVENDKLVFQGPFASVTEAIAMQERMKQHGFRALREMADDFPLGMLAATLQTPMQAPTIENEHLTVTVVPFLGARALRIVDRKTGIDIAANNTTKSLMFPFCGGEETRLGGTFRPEGQFSPFMVTTKSADAITLAAQVGGFDVTRTLTLDPDAPILRVSVEVANTSDKPRKATVRSHLELDLGELRQTRLHFTDRTGAAIERDMPSILAGLREGEHYLDQKAPNGEWTFTGTKGLQVTQRFDEAQLDFTWAYAYPEDLNDLEVEVWAKRTTVEPGQTLTFKHELEIRPAP